MSQECVHMSALYVCKSQGPRVKSQKYTAIPLTLQSYTDFHRGRVTATEHESSFTERQVQVVWWSGTGPRPKPFKDYLFSWERVYPRPDRLLFSAAPRGRPLIAWALSEENARAASKYGGFSVPEEYLEVPEVPSKDGGWACLNVGFDGMRVFSQSLVRIPSPPPSRIFPWNMASASSLTHLWQYLWHIYGVSHGVSHV